MRDGDQNTRYFHDAASLRRKKNKIKRLVDDQDVEVTSTDELCNVASSYFANLFDGDHGVYDPVLSKVLPRVNDDDNAFLVAPFEEEEFKVTTLQMHPDKAPGLDGLNPTFYQRF